MLKPRTSSSPSLDALSGESREEKPAPRPLSETAIPFPQKGPAPVGAFLAATPARRTALVFQGVSILALLVTIGFLWLRLQPQEGLTVVEVGRFERQLQRLDAGIPIDAHQQRLLLGMRDRVLLANPSIGVEAAYRYSLSILEATKLYPSVPPLLLLSMGLKGSGFEADAVGPDGIVRGLYWIDPTRARMLARALKWEFRDDLLLDSDVNTRMAALLLDVLFTEHRDTELVLADYYGGAGAPGLLRTDAEAIPPETRRLILEIKDLYEELRAGEEAESGLASRSSSVVVR